MMFSHSFTIELSLRANQDLADILRYTARVWGKKQREKYEGVLDKGLRNLAENPDIGRYKHSYGLYFANIGSHVVVYTIKKQSLYVVRVLHGRMNPGDHIP